MLAGSARSGADSRAAPEGVRRRGRRSRTVSRTARSASGFTGARASRCRAEAKPGSQPAARSAASTAATRPRSEGIAQGPAHGTGVAHAQVAAVESVPHREEARPVPGRQLRHPDPVLAGEHAAVVRLHVADDGGRPRWSPGRKRAGSSPRAPPPPPCQAHADVSVGSGAGQSRLGAQGAVTRRGRSASVGRCATNSHGVRRVVRRLEAGSVGGVEGLDAKWC